MTSCIKEHTETKPISLWDNWNLSFADIHGLIVSVVDHSPPLPLFALFLELEVLLEHWGEAVPLEHPRLVDNLVFIGR